MCWFTSVLLFTAILISQSSIGSATPLFAIRTGASCQSCHVNPTGAMLRQSFGAQYGRESLPVPAWSEGFEAQELPEAMQKVLSLGADFRAIYFSRHAPDTTHPGTPANSNAFFQMQGDIYFDFRPAKHVSFFLMKGLYSGFEAFGLLTVLPARGSIKIGKFLPNFGTRLDDHTAFIRTYTGFSPELGRPELTGVEADILPGPFKLSAGLYNSSDGFGASEISSKAYLGRAEGMFQLGEKFFIGLGGDYFSRRKAGETRMELFGGFWSFNYESLALLGETDLQRLPAAKGLVSYVEADLLLTQGLDLMASYDFYDPDINKKTGAFSRYSLGVQFFPIPGVELRPLYRITKTDPANTTSNEFDIVFHIYL